MKDTWINHNTDKLLLFILVLLGGILILHLVGLTPTNTALINWAENMFSTVLGALILILTGRINRANEGGNGSVTPSTPTNTISLTVPKEPPK